MKNFANPNFNYKVTRKSFTGRAAVIYQSVQMEFNLPLA